MADFNVPTHEIETPIGKHKVVLKDFISGYDDEAIEAVYTSGRHKVDTGNDGKNAQEFEIEGSVIQAADREAVKRVVISVDGDNGEGKPEGILGLVYNMRKEDTRFVKNAVDKVVNPQEDTPEKKANASKSTKTS